MTLTETDIETEVLAPVRQLTRQETLEHFNAQARRVVGLSGQEFLCRLDAGEYDEIVDDPVNYPGLMPLAMLAELIRPLDQ